MCLSVCSVKARSRLRADTHPDEPNLTTNIQPCAKARNQPRTDPITYTLKHQRKIYISTIHFLNEVGSAKATQARKRQSNLYTVLAVNNVAWYKSLCYA